MIRKELLPFIEEGVKRLPEKAQKEYYKEYTRLKKTTDMTYVSHFLGGLSYGYLGSWSKQLFFYFACLTGFGAIWWLINLFRVPLLVRQANSDLSLKIIRHMQKKYKKYEGHVFSTDQDVGRVPRKIPVAYDPSHLTVRNLKINFMVDYNLKTWKVIVEKQIDWQKEGSTDKLFELVSAIETIYIFIKRVEVDLSRYFVLEKKNIHILNKNIEKDISEKGEPDSLISYKERTFYKENELVGFIFNLKCNPPLASNVTGWEYFNENRDEYMFIYRENKSRYLALLGKLESEYAFSEILPVS